MIRAVFFLFFILFTWYLAGMYRYPILMILAGIEVAAFALSVPLTRSFCRKLQISFPTKNRTASVREEMKCQIEGKYSGFFPVSRFLLKLELFYRNSEEHYIRKLWGSCEKGTNEMSFFLSPSFCGVLEVQLRQLRTYDYFSVVSSKKVLSDQMKITVFPKPLSLNIHITSIKQREPQLIEEQNVGQMRDGNYEIRQIREYQPGDPVRHIHWNLSARTDSLWIKEFNRENSAAVYVTLDLCGIENGQEQCSAFYTLIYAFVTGLHRSAVTVWIQWFDKGKKMWQEIPIKNEEQCRDALALLYQSKCVRKSPGNPVEEKLIPEREDFRLNLDLELYAMDQKIHCFSCQTLEQEIRETIFEL